MTIIINLEMTTRKHMNLFASLLLEPDFDTYIKNSERLIILLYFINKVRDFMYYNSYNYAISNKTWVLGKFPNHWSINDTRNHHVNWMTAFYLQLVPTLLLLLTVRAVVCWSDNVSLFRILNLGQYTDCRQLDNFLQSWHIYFKLNNWFTSYNVV